MPYGVFSVGDEQRRVGVALDDRVVDLAELLEDSDFVASSLNGFMSAGPVAWSAVRSKITAIVNDAAQSDRIASLSYRIDEVRLHMPIEVADFVDFFSSLEHATNAGRILRPGEEVLKPNWRHLPVGYHGRAGTVVESGAPIYRPTGQVRDAQSGDVTYEPTSKLDVEVEFGFVAGVGSDIGSRVAVDDFKDHIFGAVVLIDWSARDIQAWEYQPLGPFLAKSFATTISPWVVPLAALVDAEVPAVTQDPAPLPHLAAAEHFSYDVDFEFSINGNVVSTPNFASMYWTPAQQMAHMTSNGASLRTGDLYGTGTVSSWSMGGYGSLMELTANGREPIELGDGSIRSYLLDGDRVEVKARARLADNTTIELGNAVGTVERAD